MPLIAIEAMKLATSRVPDLIILDLILPDLPGPEVLKRPRCAARHFHF